MQLRDYQKTAVERIYQAWNYNQNVCLQLATGAGKTIIMSEILKNHNGHALACAHRVELVAQISQALARNNIYHDIIATQASIRDIVKLHIEEFGKTYYKANAKVSVASVDTLIRKPVKPKISLIVQDEAHHVLKNNKFGRICEMYPDAKGLFLTATPMRADGKGLGREASGVIDIMICGMSTRELMKRGYLTTYRIFAPPSTLDLMSVPISSTGDYSFNPLRNAVHKSNILGNVVEHYTRIARGKLGITFAVDIGHAHELCDAYNAAGVPAAVISSKTKDLDRAQLMSRFRKKEIKQIVNVDILGEGVDVPAVEVVTFCRPTRSYSLYSQQFGRALRPLPGKTQAIIIDHVGNVALHGLPEITPHWTLKGKTGGTLLRSTLRTCLKCFFVYSRVKGECPYCRTKHVPESRATIEAVDGDLTELDISVLEQIKAKIDPPLRYPMNCSPMIEAAVYNRYQEKKNAQLVLREAIEKWDTLHSYVDQAERYRLFYQKFDIDMLTAKTLKARDALSLTRKILC